MRDFEFGDIQAEVVPFNEAQLKAIFKKNDKNRDNLLSRSELKEAFKELGAMIPQLRAFLGLHHADANGDGFISDDEMKDLVKYALSLGYKMR